MISVGFLYTESENKCDHPFLRAEAKFIYHIVFFYICQHIGIFKSLDCISKLFNIHEEEININKHSKEELFISD